MTSFLMEQRSALGDDSPFSPMSQGDARSELAAFAMNGESQGERSGMPPGMFLQQEETRLARRRMTEPGSARSAGKAPPPLRGADRRRQSAPESARGACREDQSLQLPELTPRSFGSMTSECKGHVLLPERRPNIDLPANLLPRWQRLRPAWFCQR